MKRIACIDGIECLFSSDTETPIVFLTTEESQSAAFVREHFPHVDRQFLHTDKPLDLFANDEEVIRHTNILDVLRKSKSDALCLSHRSSPFIESWAQENDIVLLETPWPLQQQFEEKLFFQQFLERNDLPVPPTWILRTPEDAALISNFPVVVQHPALVPPIPHSICKSAQELKAYLLKISTHLPVLCRTFVQGFPLGVTLLIGQDDVIISALRLQCFATEHPLQDFLGVHWMAKNDLPITMTQEIERVLHRLADAFRREGFLGVANVDLIASDDSVVILECNPRMSSSTPGLAVEPSLLHGLDFFGEFRRALAGDRLSANHLSIPDTAFRGSYVEFDYLIQRIPKDQTFIVIPATGFYRFEGNALHPTGLRSFSGSRECLFYTALPPIAPVACLWNLAALFTNYPLFDTSEMGIPTLNSDGQLLLRSLECSILETPPSHESAIH
jgi:hypothetical protein